jgi:methylenetetrahydrofolate--tRNA-(uracil-5-)-methyltransferase
LIRNWTRVPSGNWPFKSLITPPSTTPSNSCGAATGLAVGLTIAQLLEGREPVPVPYTTAIGSLARHCSERPPEKPFEPMNVTFGLIEDTSHSPIRDKTSRRRMMVDRALSAIQEWKSQVTSNLVSIR